MVVIGVDSKRRLYVRPLGSLSAQPLQGTEGATYPFWSPDGRFIGFFADRKLKKIDASGGALQTICEAQEGRGADWSSDGTIVFAPGVYGGLVRVAAGGGASTPLEPNPGASVSHRLPRFLPDGRHFLFFSTGSKDRGVNIFDLKTRKARFLFPSESEARYVEPGYLAFIRERNLMAQRFDAGALRTIGEATPIAEGVQFSANRYTGNFSLAGTRVLVYEASGRAEERQFVWLDLEGKRLGTIGEAGPLGNFAISPDGSRIVASIQAADRSVDLWMIDVARGVRTRFTFGAVGRLSSPVWSPDGRQVAYAAVAALGPSRLLLKDANGTAEGQEVLASRDPVGPVSWSPDGQTLAFRNQSSQTSSFDIWLLSLGDRKARPFLASRANEYTGLFSPDGKWFAYQSDESGSAELYVVPYPGPGGKWQVSSGGATSNFAWLSVGELAYESGGKHYAVTLTPRGQSLEIGAPRAILGDTPSIGLQIATPAFEYAPAVKRFVFEAPTHKGGSTPVFLVTNWAGALADR